MEKRNISFESNEFIDILDIQKNIIINENKVRELIIKKNKISKYRVICTFFSTIIISVLLFFIIKNAHNFF
jgi:hypothetical protein